MDDQVIINDSAKALLEQIVYSGKGYVETLEETAIDGKATMQVSGADTIIPENIKEEVTILGVDGTYNE